MENKNISKSSYKDFIQEDNTLDNILDDILDAEHNEQDLQIGSNNR